MPTLAFINFLAILRANVLWSAPDLTPIPFANSSPSTRQFLPCTFLIDAYLPLGCENIPSARFEINRSTSDRETYLMGHPLLRMASRAPVSWPPGWRCSARPACLASVNDEAASPAYLWPICSAHWFFTP